MLMRFHKEIRTSGLSLIQVVVVVAIIGVILAITFPVLKSVARKSEVSSCASRIKQIGLACLQYADMNDSRLFPRVNFEHRGIRFDRKNNQGKWLRAGDPAGWHASVLAYVKSSDIFFCASAKSPQLKSKLSPIEPDVSGTPLLTTYRTTISISVSLTGILDFLSNVPLSSLPEPSKARYLGEVNWLRSNHEKLPRGSNLTTSFHGEFMNHFMLDGRVVFEDMRQPGNP